MRFRHVRLAALVLVPLAAAAQSAPITPPATEAQAARHPTPTAPPTPAPKPSGPRPPLAPGDKPSWELKATQVWSTYVKDAGIGSPRLVDLNGDSVLDVVVGSGPETGGGAMTALDGRTGKRLWRVPVPNQIYSTAALLDANRDGTPDVIGGGRFPDCLCADGRTGKVLWRFAQANPGTKIPDTYFNTATTLPDLDGDGTADALLVQGGHADDTARIPGRLWVVSGATGKVLRELVAPDHREIYAVPALLPGSPPEVIAGTGGETLPGHLLRLSLADGAERWRLPTKEKGVVNAPLVAALSPGGKADVFAATFEGDVMRLDPATGAVRWRSRNPGMEAYASPAPVQASEDSNLDLVLVLNRGKFPIYREEALVTWIDGETGNTLHQAKLGIATLASPVVADLDGDGWDEVVVVTGDRFTQITSDNHRVPSTLAVYDGRTREPVLTLRLQGYSSATPALADLDADGALDLVEIHWNRVVRHALGHPPGAAARVRWGGYRGPHFDSTYP